MDKYRGLERTELIWHGEWADPEVRYDGEGFSYYALEDEIREWFKEDLIEEREWFEKNGIKNEDTEESFDLWFEKQEKERIYGIMDELIEGRREYCMERFKEQYDEALEILKEEREDDWWDDGYGRWKEEIERGRYKNRMNAYEKETVWLMASEKNDMDKITA